MKELGLFLIAMCLYIPKYAMAGGVDGGGGRGVVCRNPQGQITSAEVLDLYEGRVQRALNPILSEEPVEEQVKSIVNRLSRGRGPDFNETVMGMFTYVNYNKVLLEDGTGLLPIDDSHHVIIPKNCQIEQLANFTEQNQILINGEIWKTLNNTNKAALLVHESLYKVFRLYGATNSIRVRKAVAIGFSGGETEDLWAGVPKKYYQCHTVTNADNNPYPGTQFKAYNDENGELVFQFDYIDGELMLTKSIISVDKITMKQLSKLNDVTYWSPLESTFDQFLTVALSVNTVVTKGKKSASMKIGFGNSPATPNKEFFCALVN